MKIFDCFMFYDEELLLDIRLNILDKYVDFFIIVESKFFHNGKKRRLKFDINKFKKFEDKIIYIIQESEPEEIIKLEDKDDEDTKSYKLIINAHLRENNQRNYINEGLKKAESDDLVLISDVDEIPNFDSIDLSKINNQIIMFEQEIFYYKFNRYLPNFKWFGTKACKKKKLISPQWLRNIKNKKYSLWRLDTFFSKNKYINKLFIKNGGWHFSNIKNAKDLELKLKSYLHHRDYEAEELGYNKINKLIKNNETIYDMFGDKKSKKYGDEKRKKLEIYDLNKLPNFIQDNIGILKEWMD
ncbi:beta-1,4-mannosyl-glycoprotein beta-1,4-N-acetylglucosaminyltransferase [Candidatus Pelagibacter ubique]|uniref:Beta-1,4-mannosyl-glycoprotein beta-1,4-N-acetylglucosaminyltransferase n=1 Tax=Pelagibacter ubique TaxID=198252 RepID=A0ABX1T2I3_PELUQ|nr:beta-1,4-mannosyl-glycoprotein beta-1,4-N-acetylglucosaminyltransferase [Candidatus Pelagibacter ubique]